MCSLSNRWKWPWKRSKVYRACFRQYDQNLTWTGKWYKTGLIELFKFIVLIPVCHILYPLLWDHPFRLGKFVAHERWSFVKETQVVGPCSRFFYWDYEAGQLRCIHQWGAHHESWLPILPKIDKVPFIYFLYNWPTLSSYRWIIRNTLNGQFVSSSQLCKDVQSFLKHRATYWMCLMMCWIENW